MRSALPRSSASRRAASSRTSLFRTTGRRNSRASGLALNVSTIAALTGRELVADIIPIVPTAVRNFRPQDQVGAFLRLYQTASKSPQPVRVDARIVDERDRTRFSETTVIAAAEFARGRSAGYRLALPLQALDPGAYLLVIDAHAGRTTLEREARFWIK